jgi:HlyD family secretion protein
MDTEIAAEVNLQKRKKLLLVLLAALILLAAGVWLVRSLFFPTLKRSEITFATATVGDVDNTINASGEVLPEFEEVISSPINASIQKVILDAGSSVRAGESILTLDKSITRADQEKLQFQLESKRNEISKLKLDLGKSYFDLRSNNDIKQLHITNLADAVESARRLFNAGGGTRESIEQAELNLKVAQLEKQQLENEIKNKQQSMQIEIREAEIAAAIQENDLKALQRKLSLASVVATRNGVITYVNKNIGATIKEGETLTRIADLSSFKITGSLSDTYLDQLHNGMPTIIRINDTQLKGSVVNIHPSVQNSIITFDIRLDEPGNTQLRANMKVDVFLVTATDNHVIRVTNGPAFKGGPTQDVFVVQNEKAIRRTVHTGLFNFDFVEIKSGLQPGETIITSNMNDYKNAAELKITN